MFWADKISKEIIKSGRHKPYWVDDMKTPSGRIHVGSLRGVIIHDLIYRALLDAGVKVTFSYVIDDHDPMDGLPVYLDQKKYQKYMGQPLNRIPSPEPGYRSYADYFAREFIDVFNSCGCQPKIIWASELYQSGKMNKGIKICLDNASKIRKIYKRVAGSKKEASWHPFQVICPKCGKIGTTQVYNWDGKRVSFRCLPKLVSWAKGCGYEGQISPFDGTGKLPWKVEWAVKWQTIGITVEGAGKDHMSAGGSHDIASAICKEVLNYPVPHGFSHEFFLIGGRKMSSSKGLGSSAREMANLLPPKILRFLMTRTPYQRAIDFDPQGMTVSDLFDDYDWCASEWFKHGKKSDLGRIFELSQVDGLPKKRFFLPRFREVVNYIQMSSVDLVKRFEEEKGSKLTAEEKAILDERIRHAKIWLDSYAPKELVYQVTEKVSVEVKKLSKKQIKYLLGVVGILESKKTWEPKGLEEKLYLLAKSQKIGSSQAFQAVYMALIGKPYGPKAAWLLLDQDRNFVIKRLKKVARLPEKRKKHGKKG